MELQEGWYLTEDGHEAHVTVSKNRICALATVIGIGFVGYDMQGKRDIPGTPDGLDIEFASWHATRNERGR